LRLFAVFGRTIPYGGEGLVLPLVQFSTEASLDKTLEKARAVECDLLLIDTPPGRSSEAPAAVEAADLLLISISAYAPMLISR
jgi:cellulose biosynthesis protein BcsQ